MLQKVDLFLVFQQVPLFLKEEKKLKKKPQHLKDSSLSRGEYSSKYLELY